VKKLNTASPRKVRREAAIALEGSWAVSLGPFGFNAVLRAEDFVTAGHSDASQFTGCATPMPPESSTVKTLGDWAGGAANCPYRGNSWWGVRPKG
jgi:hypothetical protein